MGCWRPAVSVLRTLCFAYRSAARAGNHLHGSLMGIVKCLTGFATGIDPDNRTLYNIYKQDMDTIVADIKKFLEGKLHIEIAPGPVINGDFSCDSDFSWRKQTSRGCQEIKNPTTLPYPDGALTVVPVTPRPYAPTPF